MKLKEIEDELDQIEAMHFLLGAGIVILVGKVYEIQLLFYIGGLIVLYSFYLMIFHTRKNKKRKKKWKLK